MKPNSLTSSKSIWTVALYTLSNRVGLETHMDMVCVCVCECVWVYGWCFCQELRPHCCTAWVSLWMLSKPFPTVCGLNITKSRLMLGHLNNPSYCQQDGQKSHSVNTTRPHVPNLMPFTWWACNFSQGLFVVQAEDSECPWDFEWGFIYSCMSIVWSGFLSLSPYYHLM